MSETPYSHHSGNVGRPGTVHPAKTTQDQETPLAKPGLTLIASMHLADRYQLLSASDRVHQARKSFRRFDAEALHWTITGVLAGEQPDLKDKQRSDIEDAVKEVMREELTSMPQFVIALQGVELGSVHSPDGTVVAVANSGSRRFVGMLGARLRKKLKPLLKAIHPELDFGPEPSINLLPKHRVKATLGYFEETRDFRVNHDLALALEELSYVEAEIRIKSIALARFRYKSLEDATKLLDPENASNPLGESGIVDEIELQQPTDKPFRQTTAKPKLLVAPRWVDWRGYSWLFDNPGSSLIRHAETGLQQVACEPWVDPELGLYRALGDALAEAGLDSATNHYTFFNLPSASYHVTALDGVNVENLSLLSEPEKYADFLLRLPESAKNTPPDLIDAFNGVIGSDPIQFRFAGLSIWGDSVLVARLAPAGETSARILERVCAERERLDAQFADSGRPKSPSYNAHTTLGYFLTPQGARTAAANLPQWERIFRRRTAGHQLAARSISAYAFTSMETFLKLEFEDVSESMKVAICISARSRFSDDKPKITRLVNTLPAILRDHGIDSVCSVNWAHEPRSSDEEFLEELKRDGLITHWNWTPTFMGVGEVVFDALRNGFATPVPNTDFAIFLAADFDLDIGLHNSVIGNLGRLVEPLKSPSPPDLVVGDYMPLLKNGQPNRIKSGIEGHVREMVEHFFPAEWDKLRTVQRPRSEFFGIRREFFFDLTTERLIWSVFDPTVIALIEAERNPKRRWERVDLGNFYEDPAPGDPQNERRIVRQIHRTTYVISSHWVATKPGLEATELAGRLLGAVEIEMKSLNSVRGWLDEEAQ